MNPTDAICPVPRMLGWYDVAARVTFTSHDGVRVRIAHGTYLDSHEQDGAVFLGDGVEMMFHHLGLDLPRGQQLHTFCDAVTAGLANSTTATVVIDDGELLLELTPWQEVPGSFLDE
ncbi:hypothetical protein [Gordonia caeni]|uniref:DUF306 domain-containing protein n=1 Tax=Gordonia caeni TaxID=1007097 RepID=A0ABP7PIN3_9ACTN